MRLHTRTGTYFLCIAAGFRVVVASADRCSSRFLCKLTQPGASILGGLGELSPTLFKKWGGWPIGRFNGGAENAGVENAGVENAGAKTYGKPLEQKIKIRINW